MPFLAALQLLLIGLKLTDHIEWSWWWVMGPIWVPVTLMFIISFIITTLAMKYTNT